ncbi:growth-regulating factor 9-like [Nicotiana tabacum]|uniref:Growth-regulating factor n=1 Tax=Nicotiana tabacum TaxID=4097 RepID=A0A1S4AMG5_TOBAC|nr:growth-regulating factor 9 [Nicotiana tomentosiformis]XP_016477805.1 PREDICTED: growth-regulating factor 9-like [Nicotiana tabacum]
MQPHLSSATPLSHSGKDEREKKEGSPPCIKLSLGYVVEEEEKVANAIAKSVFTTAQFHELQLQAVIFKYIVSGLPVPFHLFFTIWNTVSSSLGSAVINKLYPTLGRFDYASMMDPEPGRCRRTDGKKWRCKRDVIPGQKYCGQHMHRGRRSRKLVEASEYVTKSDDISITSKRIKLNARSDDPGSKCAPASSKTSCLSSTSRNYQNNSVEDSSAKPRPTNSCNSSEKQDNHMTFNRKDTTTCIRTQSFNTDSKNIDFNRISPSKANQKQSYGDARNSGGLVPVFGISAKSDLQHTTETELQRCRRSDGKKWRCSRNAVPRQKYCETHMHRGAKKIMAASDSVINVEPSKPSSYRFCHQVIPKNDGTGINLNTSLSISTLPDPRNITEDDDSNSNSTSDATTITDEIPAFVSH